MLGVQHRKLWESKRPQEDPTRVEEDPTWVHKLRRASPKQGRQPARQARPVEGPKDPEPSAERRTDSLKKKGRDRAA